MCVDLKYRAYIYIFSSIPWEGLFLRIDLSAVLFGRDLPPGFITHFDRFSDLQVVQLVQRMAEQLPSNKLQIVFLINNYHEVMVLKSSRCLVGASEHVLGLLEE